jgi:hypothetical protein
MRIFFCIAAALAALCGQASAQRVYVTAPMKFYVDPVAGLDTNDCLTTGTACKTRQHTWFVILSGYDFGGIDPQTPGADPTMVLMAGTYTDALEIHNQPVGAHLLTIQGYSFTGTSCPDQDGVVIAPASGNGFWVQDIAIAVINCMKIAGGSGTNGIQARQHVVIDADWLDFGDLNVAVSPTDQATVNLGGANSISGDMFAFLYADVQSTIRCTAPITVTKPVAIAYGILSYTKSYVTLESACAFVNPGYVVGKQYQLWRDGDIAANGRTIPGTIPGTSVDGTGHVY